ncbi:MAG: helix-turn-helix domain-containing protein, partial [Gammaproteobacteria bacterium]
MIAATNRVPEEAVVEGKLREDLLYRLQVFPLHLPPLRERTEDIELLADYFLAEINRAENARKTISPDALYEVKGYGWPGNVRELKNIIHRAFIMADDVIDAQFLPQGLGSPQINRGTSLNIQVGMKIGEAERRLILATLERCGGSKEKTAEMLGISSKTLYNRLHMYEVQ